LHLPRGLLISAQSPVQDCPMNWITNYVRPTIDSFFTKREMPENLWEKCPACGAKLQKP